MAYRHDESVGAEISGSLRLTSRPPPWYPGRDTSLPPKGRFNDEDPRMTDTIIFRFRHQGIRLARSSLPSASSANAHQSDRTQDPSPQWRRSTFRGRADARAQVRSRAASPHSRDLDVQFVILLSYSPHLLCAPSFPHSLLPYHHLRTLSIDSRSSLARSRPGSLQGQRWSSVNLHD